MSSCLVARSSSPSSDEVECIDMLHPIPSDNTLPLISTTLGMPATIKTMDRPVVLCMAPVHRLSHEDSLTSDFSDAPDNLADKFKTTELK